MRLWTDPEGLLQTLVRRGEYVPGVVCLPESLQNISPDAAVPVEPAPIIHAAKIRLQLFFHRIVLEPDVGRQADVRAAHAPALRPGIERRGLAALRMARYLVRDLVGENLPEQPPVTVLAPLFESPLGHRLVDIHMPTAQAHA